MISNFLLSYNDHNFEQFEKLLHSDYVWYNQESSGLKEFYTRSEDSLITGNMFLAARHLHPESNRWLDKLELKLVQPGTWLQITDIGGVACEDCWETTREYYFVLMTTGGAVTYIANDLVKFVVVPVEVNGIKLYRIGRCDDIRKSS